MKFRDYVPHVKAVNKGNVSSACAKIADSAIHQRFIASSKRGDFIKSLRVEFYRQQVKDSGSYHGNSKLSLADEDLLIGIALAMVRAGEVMDAGAFKQLAEDIFPGETFKDYW